MAVLKKEIERLGKKQAVVQTRPLVGKFFKLKQTVNGLAMELAELQKTVKALSSSKPAAPTAEPEESTPARWFSGKGVLAMRKRLKLTQAQFAKLAGASAQTVVFWEKKGSKKIALRRKTLDALLSIKKMRKADAKAALATSGKKER